MHAQWLKQVQAVAEVDFQLVLDAVRKEISKKELQVDTTRAKKAREIGQHLLLFGKDDDLFVTFCQTLVTALKSCFTA